MKLNQDLHGAGRLFIFCLFIAFLPFPGLSQKSAKAAKREKTSVVADPEAQDEVEKLEETRKKRKRSKAMMDEEDFFVEEDYEEIPEPPLPRKLTVQELRDYGMVFVPGGTFKMGCDSQLDPNCFEDEKPVHEQSVTDFYIGSHEVTGRVWRSVMDGDPKVLGKAFCDECPVVDVSWEEVQVFIARLNKMTGKQFRLPTEAEWEFAAMGGKESKGYIYSGSNTLSETVWYERNTGMELKPVGTKLPNELGIYDMSGNVWEWCADLYRKYGSSEETSVTAGETKRYVMRGGSAEDSAAVCRVKSRVGYPPVFQSYSLGFRLAASQ